MAKDVQLVYRNTSGLYENQSQNVTECNQEELKVTFTLNQDINGNIKGHCDCLLGGGH